MVLLLTTFKILTSFSINQSLQIYFDPFPKKHFPNSSIFRCLDKECNKLKLNNIRIFHSYDGLKHYVFVKFVLFSILKVQLKLSQMYAFCIISRSTSLQLIGMVLHAVNKTQACCCMLFTKHGHDVECCLYKTGMVLHVAS